MVERHDESPKQDQSYLKRLDLFREKIEAQIQVAKKLVRQRMEGLVILDFDIRGALYATALELAPNAREMEAGTLMQWAALQKHEHCVDIAAGTGLLTRKIVDQTKGKIYAIDPSKEQLLVLHRDLPTVHTIQGSPDDADIGKSISPGSVDVVTSQGGIHHVHDQRRMFENIATMLAPHGRCICADVCADTTLSHHFDQYVSKKCLTGHDSQWLSEERLQALIAGLPLQLIRTERIPVSWAFESRDEMALFFKGLHAYDLTEQEILADLQEAIGIFHEGGKYRVNWPLLFFQMQKQE